MQVILKFTNVNIALLRNLILLSLHSHNVRKQNPYALDAIMHNVGLHIISDALQRREYLFNICQNMCM